VSKPLVAIAGYHLEPGRVTNWEEGAFAVPDVYVEAVRRAGGRPVLLLGRDDEPAESLLQPFDALVLAGGGDVDPSEYGATDRHPRVYGIDPARDSVEIDAVLAADQARLPTLAICRGIQVMNVAFGGTLHQHLGDVSGFDRHRLPPGGSTTHDVKVSESSRLAEATSSGALRCWSAHHQGIDRVGEGLSVVGVSEDGLAEALEREDGWMVGVQWHPERTAATDPAQQALFDELVRQAR